MTDFPSPESKTQPLILIPSSDESRWDRWVMWWELHETTLGFVVVFAWIIGVGGVGWLLFSIHEFLIPALLGTVVIGAVLWIIAEEAGHSVAERIRRRRRRRVT